MFSRYILATSLIGLSALSFVSCGPGTGVGTLLCPQQNFFQIVINQQSIGINQRIPIQVLGGDNCGRELEYRFVANRGQIIAQNPLSPVAEYIAPFTGGEDMITVSVFDRTNRVNLPQQQRPLLILGDGLAYVEAPAAGTELGDFDNGVIKIAGVQGLGSSTPSKQIAVGRQPTISPNGRYLAYTYYPGDGSSQVRMQDAAGNVTILTGNGGSFNRDPSWAPIGNDLNLNLTFSSDRLSNSSGQGFDERGDAFNIWRVSALGQNMQQLASTPGNDQEPVWSPDGRSVLYRSNFSQNKIQNFDNLWQLDLASGRLLQLTYETVPDKGVFQPEFSPLGDRVVYSRKYLSRQAQQVFDFQKIWTVALNTIDIPSLIPFQPGTGNTLPGSGSGTVPGPNRPINQPNAGDSTLNREGNFGNIATQEFDEGTIESSPSFSVDGRWITYVRKQGDDIRVVSIPGNPGNLGTVGFEPVSVLPQGSERALEVNWARQIRSFGR